VTRRRDKIEKSVNSVIPETRVTFDARFLGQYIIVLTLEVPDYLLETASKSYILFVYRT
jgi:hypothetical protein